MPTYHPANDKMMSAFSQARSQTENRDRFAAVEFGFDQAKASTDPKTDEPRGAALSERGVPVLIKAKIKSLQDRSNGSADVQITFNGDLWGSTSKQQQVAACDHCLTSLETLMDDEDAPKLDAHERPKLRKRKPDFVLFGFHEVAARHGKHSVEVSGIKLLCHQNGQTYLPWLDDGSDVPALTPARPTRTAPKKLGKGSKYRRGDLKPKPLRERLARIKKPSTWLAVAWLEHADSRKNRQALITSIEDRVREEMQLQAYTSIKQGDDSALDLDKAAAVLLTTKGLPAVQTLDTLVAECLDPDVISMLIDEEEMGEERDEVLQVMRSRLADITPPPPTESAANDQPVVH